MARRRKLIKHATLGLLGVSLLGGIGFFMREDSTERSRRLINKDLISQAIGKQAVKEVYPTEIALELDGKPTSVIVQYSFDPSLQEAMDGWFKSYKPDYGAFVAIDAKTGRVLSMVSYSHKNEALGNLTLKATFPSASVFKVVTAAAAISEKKFSAHTLLPVNGSYHTLYKRNVFQSKDNKWTRYLTLKEAFARSVNSVFGKIGAFNVGAEELGDYASRFGFNRTIHSDVPIEQGRAMFTQDSWQLAEAASGYTKDNTMSPLQGALIAATIANDGASIDPYVVESMHTLDGTEVYHASPTNKQTAIDVRTARELKELMRETVARGTSKGSFRRFFKGSLSDLDVGGKTGTLTGENPSGKYDWFVGYADLAGQTVAFAALTVNQKYWTVKSAYLARLAIENIFKRDTLDLARATIIKNH